MALLMYMAQVILCSGLFFGYYLLVLRNKRFHSWNRFYLLLSTATSLLIPFLKIPIPFTNTTHGAVYTYTQTAITIRDNAIHVKDIAPQPFLVALYAIIALVLLFNVYLGYRRIMKIIRNSRTVEGKDYKLVISETIPVPFSFFSYIFWTNNHTLSSPENQQILAHELIHVHQKHTLFALCWINPLFYFIKRELALIHEFIADENAAGEDIALYAETMVTTALQTKNITLVNNFSYPPIKRRLIMLSNFNHPKFSYLRRLMVLPVAGIVLFTFACTKGVEHTNEQLSEEKAAMSQAKEATPNEIFTFVEHPPTFKGGEIALMQYLSSNVLYPRKAQEANISGTVFVQFVVTDEGKVAAVKTVGAPKGAGLEEEAIRVVKSMPNWNPGTQNGRNVNVQFNLPIRFTLSE